eukprot:1142632-Pelagomonas_calceolata.AAC.3
MGSWRLVGACNGDDNSRGGDARSDEPLLSDLGEGNEDVGCDGDKTVSTITSLRCAGGPHPVVLLRALHPAARERDPDAPDPAAVAAVAGVASARGLPTVP